MAFTYKCGDVEGSCHTDFNTPTHTNILSKFNENGLLRKVLIEKKDEFGTYEVELVHDIRNAHIELNIASFNANKPEKNFK